jgi:serine/threonine protein phosphatase PrpC
MKKVYKNYSNKPNYASANKKRMKNVDNNISYSDDEDNNDSYGQNFKLREKSPQNDYNYNKKSKFKKISKYNDSLNNDMKLNRGSSAKMIIQDRKTYSNFDSDLRDNNYYSFNNYKRAFSGEKSYRPQNFYGSFSDIKYNSINSITSVNPRYTSAKRNDNILISNYAPTNSNTKVVKIKKMPKDEIAKNVKRNLNDNFKSYRNNNNYHSSNDYYSNSTLNQTAPNIPVQKYINDFKTMNNNSNFNNFNNYNLSNNFNNYSPRKVNNNQFIESSKNNNFNNDFELPEGNNTAGYYSIKKPFSSNVPNYQRIGSDIQPKIINKVSNPISRNPYSIGPQIIRENEKNREYLNDENDMDDEDDDKFHNLSSTMDFLSRTTPITQVQNGQINFIPFTKQPQFNNSRSPDKSRITIVKKLPPLNNNSINNINNGNPFNRPPVLNSNQYNRPIITPINNNMNALGQMKSTPSNNPRVKVQMIDREGNPIQRNRNNQNSSLGMSPDKNNEIINKNAAKIPANNPRPNAAYIPSVNQSENQQNRMIINRNYITQNQASMTLLNKNQQFQQQPNNYMNQINNQNKYGPNNQPMINQNQMLSEQNNLNSNEETNEDEDQMPEENINPEPLRDPEGNLLNVESGRITMANEEEGENNQNQNMANENNENTKKNDVDISYNDFDDSGWVKNYGGVTRPGKNIKGEQKINQDSLVSLTNINNIKDFNIFGILDGHGPQGHNVSLFASKFIPAQIVNHPEIKGLSDPEAIYEKLKDNNCQIITNAYLTCDEQLKNAEFDAYNSGSTCILIIHIGNHIICSNVGDSRGLVSFDEQIEGDDELNYLEAAQLSIDYKPELLEEQKRILMSGGVVEKMKNEFGQGVGPFRVWARGKEFPGLAMSRSIGDLNSKNIGIISDPGILEYDLSESTKFIVVCSDGVWEFLTNENVIDLGKSFYLNNDASGFCHQIVDQSVLQWEKNDIIIDDITVVVAFFNT